MVGLLEGGNVKINYRTLRDGVVTFVVLVLLVYEVIGEARPEVLVLFGSLLAVPAFLRADEKIKNGNGARG